MLKSFILINLEKNLISSWNNFKNGKSNIIYISPERLMTDNMISNLRSFEIGLFVIDEIHCVSKWGQSFRPDYEKLSKLKIFFQRVILLVSLQPLIKLQD